MADPRDRQLAELLVDTCVGVQPGWQVLVIGTPQGRPLLEEIVRLVGERDAYALLRVAFDSNFASRAWLQSAPLERIAIPAAIEQHSLETCDALIAIDAPENTRDASSLDTERTAAIQGAYRPAMERVFRHEVPWVGCQYPTAALAQDAGMSTDEFAEFLYGACLLDWDAERERMQRYADRFDAADEVRIVGAETDIRLSIAGRSMKVDAGGANIPGGEFFGCPVEDSAE
jgi:aminopeptidase